MRLKGLDILLTYECTGSCAHCCYRAGPGQGDTMTLAEVEGYLTAVADQPLEAAHQRCPRPALARRAI